MRLRLLLLICLAAVSTARGQTTETPVPFDSAGRVQSVNPPLVARLGLTQPAWPVTGEFTEARLFRVSTGGYSLAVTRLSGSIDRFSLDEPQVTALRTAFAEGMARSGGPVAEDAANVISEPARGPFVRDQMILASVIYGPALASLTDDGAAGSGVYLLSVGGTFFLINDFARRRTITKAQNSLTTDGAYRGWAAVALAAAALDAHFDDNTSALMALGGGIGGSMVGYHRGRTLTNSEAQSAMTFSTMSAAAALGGLAVVKGKQLERQEQLIAGTALAGGIAGYVLGPKYPRRASYTVTAGDVQLVRLGAILGTMAILTPFAEVSHMDTRVGAALATTGWIGGALIADRIAAKPFNHSEGDARMIGLGTVGGALMVMALPSMARSESGLVWAGAATSGAIAGAIITQRMMAPSRDGSVMRSVGSSAAGNGGRFELNPEGALLAVTKQRGNHTLLRIRF